MPPRLPSPRRESGRRSVRKPPVPSITPPAKALTSGKKLRTPEQAVMLCRAWAEHEVVNSTPDLLFRAFALQQRHQISVWDALVVQAALDANCTTLYSEDLNHGMRFGALEIVNPFATPNAVHEAAEPYAVKTRAVRRDGKTDRQINPWPPARRIKKSPSS